MKHPITKTRNGKSVYVDLVKSRAGTQIAQQPNLLRLVEEVIRQSTVNVAKAHIQQDMGRAIGYNFIVETKETDSILYGRLLRDEVYTRFVKNGKPLPTQYLTMILIRDEEGSYELTDTWIGTLHPPRPGSAEETAVSKDFWAKHAYVLEGKSVQIRTATKVCPY